MDRNTTILKPIRGSIKEKLSKIYVRTLTEISNEDFRLRIKNLHANPNKLQEVQQSIESESEVESNCRFVFEHITTCVKAKLTSLQQISQYTYRLSQCIRISKNTTASPTIKNIHNFN